MDFLKRNASTIIVCVFEVLVGILLLIDPATFTSGIIIAVGVGLVIAGVIEIVDYFRTSAVEAALKKTLVKGLAMLLVGIFCVMRPSWLVSTFPLLTILYGIFILFLGLSKVQWTVDALRLKTGRWFLHAISALVSIIFAIVILQSPFESTYALWLFTGIALIVEAVIDIVMLFFNNKGGKMTKSAKEGA